MWCYIIMNMFRDTIQKEFTHGDGVVSGKCFTGKLVIGYNRSIVFKGNSLNFKRGLEIIFRKSF